MIFSREEQIEPAMSKFQVQNSIGSDGLVYNIYRGNQTGSSVKKVGQQLAKLFAKQRQKNRPVLLLTDISGLGDVNLSARKVGLEVMRNLDYDRCAIIGSNFITAGLVKLMITASGMGFKVQMFDSLKDAKKWLFVLKKNH